MAWIKQRIEQCSATQKPDFMEEEFQANNRHNYGFLLAWLEHQTLNNNLNKTSYAHLFWLWP